MDTPSCEPPAGLALLCPTCGAQLERLYGTAVLSWRCPGGHTFAIQALHAALRSAGWRPRLDRRLPSRR